MILEILIWKLNTIVKCDRKLLCVPTKNIFTDNLGNYDELESEMDDARKYCNFLLKKC